VDWHGPWLRLQHMFSVHCSETGELQQSLAVWHWSWGAAPGMQLLPVLPPVVEPPVVEPPVVEPPVVEPPVVEPPVVEPALVEPAIVA
jgi:hypothetical protein